jgi:hypothetical protein
LISFHYFIYHMFHQKWAEDQTKIEKWKLTQ